MNDELEEYNDEESEQQQEEANEDHALIHTMITAITDDDLDAALSAFHSSPRPDVVVQFMLFALMEGEDHYMPTNKTLGAQTAVALLTAKVTDGGDFIALLTDLMDDEPTNLLAAVDTLTDMTIDQIMQLAAHHGADPSDQERTVLTTLAEWGKLAADND